MSVTLIIGNNSFEYPINGTGNYGEEATNWAIAVTEALKEVKNVGDISVTEVLFNSFDSGPTTDRVVTGLFFDISFVQRISIQGIITREFTTISGKPPLIESFVIEGIWNGNEMYFSQEFSGQDTDVVLYTNTGSSQFRALITNLADQLAVKIKFSAKTIIDQNAI